MKFLLKLFGFKTSHIFDLKKPMIKGTKLYRLKPGLKNKRYEEIKSTSFVCLGCGKCVHATKEQISKGLPKEIRYCD